MKNQESITGSCLCGSVQFEVAGPFLEFNYCYCGRCRKAGGGAHSAHLFIEPAQLTWISGESETAIFLHPMADGYPRRFCTRCGSAVPRLARDCKRMVVPAGTLDADPGCRPDKNLFWSLRAPWVDCEHGLPTYGVRPGC